jgi:hypothetical protein
MTALLAIRRRRKLLSTEKRARYSQQSGLISLDVPPAAGT